MSGEGKIICWNCCGASSGQFHREIRELKWLHKLMMLILLEPKVSGLIAGGVCRGLGMSSWCHSGSEGFSGRIWILWNEEITVSVRNIHKFSVHAKGESAGGGDGSFLPSMPALMPQLEEQFGGSWKKCTWKRPGR